MEYVDEETFKSVINRPIQQYTHVGGYDVQAKYRQKFRMIKRGVELSEGDKTDIKNSVVNMINTTRGIVSNDHMSNYLTREQREVYYRSEYFKQVSAELGLASDKDPEISDHAKHKDYEHAVALKRSKFEVLEVTAATTAMNGPVEVRDIGTAELVNVTSDMLPRTFSQDNGKAKEVPSAVYGQLADYYINWLAMVRSWISARSAEGLVEHTDVYREIDRLTSMFRELVSLPAVIMSDDMMVMLAGGTMHKMPDGSAFGIINKTSANIALRVNHSDVSVALPLIERGGKINLLEASRYCEIGHRRLYKDVIANRQIFLQKDIAPKVLLIEGEPIPSIVPLIEKIKAVWTSVLGISNSNELYKVLMDSLRSAQLNQAWYAVTFKTIPINAGHTDFVRVHYRGVELELMSSREAFSYIKNTVAMATPLHPEPESGYEHVFYAADSAKVPDTLYLTGEKPILIHKAKKELHEPGIYKTVPTLTKMHDWPSTDKEWKTIGLYRTHIEAEAACFTRDQYVKRMHEAEAAAFKAEAAALKAERDKEDLRKQLNDKEAAIELERRKHEDTHRLQQKKHEEELALKAETLRVKEAADNRDANLREAKQEAEIIDMRFRGYLDLEKLKQSSRDALYKGMNIVAKSPGGSVAAHGLLGVLSGLANAGQGVSLGAAFNAVDIYVGHLSAEERCEFVEAMYSTEVANFKSLANWMENKYEKLERKRTQAAAKNEEKVSQQDESSTNKQQLDVDDTGSTSDCEEDTITDSAPGQAIPPKSNRSTVRKVLKAVVVGAITMIGGLYFGVGMLVALGAGVVMGGITAI